jgi:cytoskeletal protein CcmA (bactofilin family)
MGETSRIKGSVMVDTAIIAGEIIGNVICYDYLELQPSSIIKGNIEYNSIEIHAGAKVNGELKQIAKAQVNNLPKDGKKVQKKLPFKKDSAIGEKNDT